MAQLSRSRVADVRDFILSRDEIDEAPLEDSPDPFWQGLSGVGSMIWFDTGDIDAASSNWSAEMSALTTNNSLLNKEVQKGIYDDLIVRAKEMLGSMEPDDLVMEVAFILNAVHGMRLARRFNADVSVELHTGISYDVEAIAHYGKRFHEINPDRFIVKVPFTSDGILGARVIREAGIRVNLTLGFSARQNVIAAVVSKPNFVNVFLGRLNSFVADNGLGTGNMIGEKTTLASQRSVHSVTQEFVEPVHQIAASIRGAGQLEALAGVDVITMPTDVAEEAKQRLRGPLQRRLSRRAEGPRRRESGSHRHAVGRAQGGDRLRPDARRRPAGFGHRGSAHRRRDGLPRRLSPAFARGSRRDRRRRQDPQLRSVEEANRVGRGGNRDVDERSGARHLRRRPGRPGRADSRTGPLTGAYGE